MSIIRQVNQNFAVPDLRNSATLVRLLIVLLISLFIFPLMTVSGVSYPEQIFQHFSWACPVILLILLKVHFLQASAPSLLRSQYSVVVSYISNLLIFLFVDLVILKTEMWPLIQHFFLLTFSCFSFMYIEAARRNSLASSISEAGLSALTACIRLHFLFNSLNAAISLIRLRPYDAETLLENLVNLFRAQLRDGSQNSTLGQEIEWAQEYIATEQIHMGYVRVQAVWQHHAPDDVETPYLSLQSLLENAVFHGVESSHRPGIVTILTELEKSSIFISIENPYGTESNENAKPHKGNSMALHNLRERLTLTYDTDAKIRSIQSGGLFRVEIILPYRKKPAGVSRPSG